jgi:hypothetical protein
MSNSYPETKVFELLMNERLYSKHDERNGKSWGTEPQLCLLNELDRQRNELAIALTSVKPTNPVQQRQWAERIVKQTLDVANYAMMIADNTGFMETLAKEVEAHREQYRD